MQKDHCGYYCFTSDFIDKLSIKAHHKYSLPNSLTHLVHVLVNVAGLISHKGPWCPDEPTNRYGYIHTQMFAHIQFSVSVCPCVFMHVGVFVCVCRGPIIHTICSASPNPPLILSAYPTGRQAVPKLAALTYTHTQRTSTDTHKQAYTHIVNQPVFRKSSKVGKLVFSPQSYCEYIMCNI